jgi:rare lipoprotein A
MLGLNRKHWIVALLVTADLALLGGGIAYRDNLATLKDQADQVASDGLAGIASWYGDHWQGRKTASGTRFDVKKLTAAHRTLPFNTRVRVTNLDNGKSVIVLVNDRGPYVDGRVIDLSTAAARRLGMVKKGLVPVKIEIVPPPAATPKAEST